MIQLKNSEELQKIRKSCALLVQTFKEIEPLVQEGVTTKDIDQRVYQFITRNGGIPSFLGYLDFPASVCISLNQEVIHGIPGSRKLLRGDIVGIDIGINLDGYFSDAAYTYAVDEISPERRELLKVTRECLFKGVEAAQLGARVSDISKAIYNHAVKHKYSVVREYCGHGVGFSQHEEPSVPNYLSSGPNPRLQAGMVLALEPMINAGTWKTRVLADNWTVVTKDGSDSAHFEYTIALKDEGVEVLTPL